MNAIYKQVHFKRREKKYEVPSTHMETQRFLPALLTAASDTPPSAKSWLVAPQQGHAGLEGADPR